MPGGESGNDFARHQRLPTGPDGAIGSFLANTSTTPVSTTSTASTTPVTTTPVSTTPVTTTPVDLTAQVVPGQANPNAPNQIGVVDYAGQVATNPSLGFTLDDPNTPDVNESMFLSQRNGQMDVNAGLMDQQAPVDYSGTNMTAAQSAAAQAANITPQQAATYQAQLTQQDVQQNGQMVAAQGTVSQGSQINPEDIVIDTEAVADGRTGVGAALQEFAVQDLGDVDPKATVKGQLEELQSDFFGPDGEPKIPNYAQGLARNVSKIMTFKGMSGSAAASAMSQALMEASISVAEQDAKFFQTLTLQNLNNKQEATLNRANVLSKMELANMDNRMAAAVQNAKNFMEMDLANLDNRQQAAVLNTQNRVQSILEDARSVNAQRLFGAEQENDFARFYDSMNDSINRFNATQVNEMSMFNTDQANAASRFNADLENNREQFYRTMQYNVDLANAQWRQNVTLTEDQQSFEAAATDVRNMLGLSVEQLNQVWDRSDALLDYLWKTTDNKLERDNQLLLTQIAGQNAANIESMRQNFADSQATGQLFGTIFSSFLGSSGGQNLLSNVGDTISSFLF